MRWCIMEPWDDIRLFLALARGRTSRVAARHLGVNQSTVSRRLSALEEASGVRLFERGPTGLVLTEAGHEVLVAAERIEEEFAVLERQVLGRDTRLAGRIRLSLPDLGVAACAPTLAEFSRLYPDVNLEVTVDNGYVELGHQQADVALRLGTGPPEHLVGRRIAATRVAVYASPAYLDRQPDPSRLADLDWVRWEEPWRRIPPERWTDEHVPPERTRARVNTNLALVELLAAGLGVGFQLCLTADVDPRLRRVAEPASFGLSLWLLTHEDLRRTSRIRAFLRFVGDALTAKVAALDPGPPDA
jgi:DNA-binding transcriptional LysR family regulator